MTTFTQRCFFLLALTFCLGWSLQGQTILAPGDLAFTGYRADGSDEFAFVLLTEVEAGTIVNFTDNGWLASGDFRTGEGVITLTFGAAYSCGTEVLYGPDGFFVGDNNVGTVSTSGSLVLSTSGDQIFAFQGTLAAPSLVAGIQMNGNWDGDASSSNASAQPASLIGASLAIDPEVDNAVYVCEITGDTPAAIRAAVTDPILWEGDNSGDVPSSSGCAFNCGSPMMASCSELFISEYMEGSSFNKCIEIYNPTASTIDLAAGGYGIALYSNGAGSVTDDDALSGTIISGGTYVVCHVNADFAPNADATAGSINFNGDDAFALTKDGVNIDVIGQIGVDPGSQWGSDPISTANNTLRRNPNVTMGDADGSDAFDPAVEWTGYAQNNADNFGQHTSECVEAPACMITGLFITDILGCNNGGTPGTNDDFFAFNIVVAYENAPATGNLVISGDLHGNDIVVPVADLTGSPFTITGTYNPNFPYPRSGISGADGLALPLAASFTDEPLCVFSNPDAGPAQPPCSIADPCTELFFSEYIEGSGNNKCLEIYNPAEVDVDLAAAGYRIEIYFNGSMGVGTTIDLTGTIPAGGVYVVCDDASMPQFLAAADQISFSSFFNGDDAIALVNNDGYTDVIGQIGVDPGSSWSGSGISTQNQTLIRPFGITGGDKNGFDAFDPSAGYIGLPQDDASDLGNHVSECNPYPPGYDPYTIGDCGGETGYDFDTGTFTLSTNCFSSNPSQDAHHTVLKDMCGDGEVITRVVNVSTPDWAGIQIRESLAPGSKMVAVKTNLTNFLRRDVRANTNGNKLSQMFFRPAAVWLRLVRSGTQFVGYASVDGNSWQLILVVNVQMDACVYAGIYVESFHPSHTATAMFDNVSVTSSFEPLGLSVDNEVEIAARRGENVVYPFGVQLPGVSTEANTIAAELNVFPNPATDKLNVALPQLETTSGELSIVDLNGKVLYRQPYQLDGQQISLDLGALQLSEGMYQIVLSTDNQVITKRFVKTN
ncbi:MAG: hypothetical protein DHS20C18_24170 [Saprospiraceae bacterium]|nr:MAG: hypothetical protein DHS20C18_24170 [Saprospiraceae bacterium]